MKIREKNPAGCYDGDWLASYVSSELDPEEMAEVACHLAECEDCAAVVRELSEWTLARIDVESGDVPEEARAVAERAWRKAKQEILRKTWLEVDASFLPQRSYAAAADGQTADQVLSATANGAGFVRFASIASEADAWRVRIARLPNPTEDSILRIEVTDASGAPIPAAQLKYRGISVEVQDGKAYLPIRDLQTQAESMISLRRGDGPEIPGTLVLGEG